MSVASALREIQNVSEIISSFLTNPDLFTPTNAANIINLIELIKGAVRELPLGLIQKTDILNQLSLAETSLQNTALEPSDELLAALAALQITVLKINNLVMDCKLSF